MAMSVKSTSRFQRRRRGGAAFTDINVTPMVDVMLVLLIVFMVTAPMLTVGVPVDLPKTQAAKLNDQVEPIIISVDALGKSYLQEMELEGEALIARLRAITDSNPDARIYVRGDKNLAYGRVMEIMGEVAASGFSKVSLIAEMPTAALKVAPHVAPKPGPVAPALNPKPALAPQSPLQAGPKQRLQSQPPKPAMAPPKSTSLKQPSTAKAPATSPKPAVKKGP